LEELSGLVDEILTRRLLTSARRYGAPIREIESDPENWSRNNFGASSLVTVAFDEIAARRNKARRESVTFWMQIIGSLIGWLTGLIGATIGLLAFLQRKP
jgi:hypothetical protein